VQSHSNLSDVLIAYDRFSESPLEFVNALVELLSLNYSFEVGDLCVVIFQLKTVP
jgi:hypothetical protein